MALRWLAGCRAQDEEAAAQAKPAADGGDERGRCDICGAEIDWSRGGNSCCRCHEPACEEHADY